MSVTSVGYNPVTPMPLSAAMPLPADFRGQVRQNDIAVNEKAAKPQIISSTTQDIERIGDAFNKKLKFEVDQSSNQVIVKVIDKDTDKVIKELPPEELQRLHSKLKETIGFLFDQRV